jgi:hypothetical protein
VVAAAAKATTVAISAGAPAVLCSERAHAEWASAFRFPRFSTPAPPPPSLPQPSPGPAEELQRGPVEKLQLELHCLRLRRLPLPRCGRRRHHGRAGLLPQRLENGSGEWSSR